jgi:hypothetical protein
VETIEAAVPIVTSVADILKSAGVPFPEGASANYLVSTHELVVRNTPENMTILEEWIERPTPAPRSIVVTAQVVEADAGLLRRLAAENAPFADHRPAWEAVIQAVAGGTARVLRTASLPVRSGNRALCTAGRSHSHPTGASVRPLLSRDAGSDDDGDGVGSGFISSGGPILAFDFDQRLVGFTFEVDPVIGPDGSMIDVNYHATYSYAAPARERPRTTGADGAEILDPGATSFHQAVSSGVMAILNGAVRMAGLWSPAAGDDDGAARPGVLQALFIRAETVEVPAGGGGG